MQQNIGRKIIKKRRVFSCLLMIMMIFNMLGSTSGYQVFAADDGYRFRSIEVTVDGTKLEDYSEKIVQDATVKLRCEWEVDNNVKLAGGEQLVLDIPDIFDLGSDDLSGDLQGSDGNYGTWDLDVSERELILTFGELPGTQSNVEGYVEFNLQINLTNKVVRVPYEMSFPVNGSTTKTFQVNFEMPDGKTIEKLASRMVQI